MEGKENNKTFNYTYSPQQQEEIKNIRQKYLPPEADKMEQLRLLDKSAKRIGTTTSLAIGIVSSLLFGTGMACIMEWDLFTLGIIVGSIGIAFTYPIYMVLIKRQRKKLAPQILKLSEELMK